MPSTEVEFEPDERALLDWLRTRVKKDGALSISDTVLIEQLRMTEDTGRFFTAKMRLVAAGALSLFVDGNGRQVIQLNLPELPAAPSSRYVFLVVPMAIAHDVKNQTKAYRLKQVNKAARRTPIVSQAQNGGKPASVAALPTAAAVLPTRPALPQPRKSPDDHAKAQSDALRRLGVRPRANAPQPIRPPIRSPAKST